MMGLDERVFYFCLGLFIGAVLGFLTRAFFKIDEKVAKIEAEERKHMDKDSGRVSPTVVNYISLLAVVLVVAFGSFQSQKISNRVEAQQEDLKEVVTCTEVYLSETIQALNERTTYSVERSEATLALQRSQLDFLILALQDPPLEFSRVEEGLRDYQMKVRDYIDITNKSLGKANVFPYPDQDGLTECIENYKD